MTWDLLIAYDDLRSNTLLGGYLTVPQYIRCPHRHVVLVTIGCGIVSVVEDTGFMVFGLLYHPQGQGVALINPLRILYSRTLHATKRTMYARASNFKVNYTTVVHKNKIAVFNKVYVHICKLHLQCKLKTFVIITSLQASTTVHQSLNQTLYTCTNI